MVREHFEKSDKPGVLQIPVGCGKTGIIATLPFGIARGRVLVVTPNVTIRKGVVDALDVTSRQCFWSTQRVLSDFTAGPWTAVLDGPSANIHDAIESDFVVTNVQQLASQADRWLPQFPQDFFDMILIDEGHHAAAESWQKVLRRFPNAKVISLTATPFRADQQGMHGEILYRYPFTRAMVNGYIKQIHSRSVAPSELYFTYQDDSTVKHTLEEVLQLREDAWFRRGVALSPECNRHIVETSIAQCDRMRAATGIKHQIIAAACSVDHARQVRALYQECGYEAAEIHSDMDEDARDAVIDRLKTGRLDCIVQVQMLGEGFDHPRLSIGAIFRPYRSLAPYRAVRRASHARGPAQRPQSPGQPRSHRVARRAEQRGPLDRVPRPRPRGPGARAPVGQRHHRLRRGRRGWGPVAALRRRHARRRRGGRQLPGRRLPRPPTTTASLRRCWTAWWGRSACAT